ncbi:hypothetical protein FC756_03055 [Lysinibacillus mangiferihumi]|uniref:Uncharacterized protein n=1 Tax=Lysinibacillus mangiferihumi TaxID=1130819 RepID=A0A4V5TMI7_9BACI|nr:hypothetical protein [Lysinibacillus mangiferihumi]TKI72003.1 hypothetical protein FC756_03055 [Lysinibacillus mangiferihumi]
MTDTEEKLIQIIQDMSEEEVKAKFTELMWNYYRIKNSPYSEEECMNDYVSMYKTTILRKLKGK